MLFTGIVPDLAINMLRRWDGYGSMPPQTSYNKDPKLVKYFLACKLALCYLCALIASKVVDDSYSVHDGDILPMLTALNIISTPHLPVTHRLEDRDWHTSQLVPMSGRVIFELLSCAPSSPASQNHNQFVRININDGIVALPDCADGPGGSCPMKAFLDYVRRRGEAVGRFGEICGLDENAAEAISFLHQ